MPDVTSAESAKQQSPGRRQQSGRSPGLEHEKEKALQGRSRLLPRPCRALRKPHS